MKEQLRQALEEHFTKEAGYGTLAVMDKVAIELALSEVTDEMLKEAADPLMGMAHLTREAYGAVGQSAGKLGVGLLGALAVAGIIKGIGAIKSSGLRAKFETALQHVKTKNYILKSADPKKIDSFAETIFNFAPHVASDVNILSSLLANAVHGESLDPKTVQSIVDLESKYVDKGSFNIKNYVG